MAILRSGSRGIEVAQLQTALNSRPSGLSPLKVDGIFGPTTLARVREFQAQNGLTVDGIAGPATYGRLFGNTSIAPNTVAQQGSFASSAENISGRILPVAVLVIGVLLVKDLISAIPPPKKSNKRKRKASNDEGSFLDRIFG